MSNNPKSIFMNFDYDIQAVVRKAGLDACERIKQLQSELDKLEKMKKLCMTIMKYNENISPKSEKFFIRHDMFLRLQQALKGGE